MERVFSQQSIELYRKLLDLSNDQPQRRLIFKFLEAQAHMMQMGATTELRVKIERRGDKYSWELHRDCRLQPVKFSAPIFLSEEAARASGDNVRTRYLARLPAGTAETKQYARAIGVRS
jgi:hypothetical protein